MSTILKTDWSQFRELSPEQRKRYLQFKFLTQINIERWIENWHPSSPQGDNWHPSKGDK